MHLIALWWYVAWRSMVPLMPSCIVALLQAIVNARGIPCLVNLLSSPSAAVQVLSTSPRALPFCHCLKPDTACSPRHVVRCLPRARRVIRAQEAAAAALCSVCSATECKRAAAELGAVPSRPGPARKKGPLLV